AEFKKLFLSAKVMAGEAMQPLDVIRDTFQDYQPWHYWVQSFSGGNLSAYDLEYDTSKSFSKNDDNFLLAVRWLEF
ncbi:MAG: hypothetical protein WCL71_10135, partial [Deltaproteobacteria bacterium]